MGRQPPKRVWFVQRIPNPDHEPDRYWTPRFTRMYTTRRHANQFVNAHPTSTFRVWWADVEWTEEPF